MRASAQRFFSALFSSVCQGSRLAAFLGCGVISGCTLITDVDRDKIPEPETPVFPEVDGGPIPEPSTPDASPPDGLPDAGTPDTADAGDAGEDASVPAADAGDAG